jgi:multidrug transporter EmrE-like cation transporter
LGITLVGVQVALGKTKLQWRNVVAGIVLGIPNFFSIYYLIRLLNSDWLESSAAIPVNNIGIVVASALVAILFFKEPFTQWRAVGIALSILAIILIAL